MSEFEEKSSKISMKKFRKAFRTEESKFRLSCSLKIVGIFYIGLIINFYIFWILLDLNHLYFSINGFPNLKGFRETFFDYLFTDTWPLLMGLLGFGIVLFFIGNYVASVLLRPINKIGSYCEGAVNSPNLDYNPDQLIDLKTLTRFSEFFFQYIARSRKEGRFLDPLIPQNFLKIRKPVLEKAFLLHLILIFVLICLVSSFVLYSVSAEVFSNLASLGVAHLDRSDPFFKLFEHQQGLVHKIFVSNLFILVGLYSALAMNLYNSISSAAFGVFATFRAFTKGSHHNRVHIIGHNFVRPDTRLINKFLETVEGELSAKEKTNK